VCSNRAGNTAEVSNHRNAETQRKLKSRCLCASRILQLFHFFTFHSLKWFARRVTSMNSLAGPWNHVAVIHPSSCQTVAKRAQSPASCQSAQFRPCCGWPGHRQSSLPIKRTRTTVTQRHRGFLGKRDSLCLCDSVVRFSESCLNRRCGEFGSASRRSLPPRFPRRRRRRGTPAASCRSRTLRACRSR
jgi:hypothetical protein